VRDHDANSAGKTLTQTARNVVDFAYIHHCVFVYPQRVTMTHARDKRSRAHSYICARRQRRKERARQSEERAQALDARLQGEFVP
jgi:hypothetical protein